MSPEAEDYMKGIAKLYHDSGRPPAGTMKFDEGKAGPIYSELRALGLIKRRDAKGSGWVLTNAGQHWVVENLEDTDTFDVRPHIP